jgi:cation diffusion facilitator CzcD-associated flavoprotein CzcO
VLDRDATVGGTWERRFDRLRLHTVRRFSGLPFRALPASAPRYVTKDAYARYLHEYAAALALDVRLGEEVTRVAPLRAGWSVQTVAGGWEARAVVVATGRHNVPRLPRWPGVDDFRGSLLHSADYRSGRELGASRVLVVGLGNSGAEIAADLVEDGAAHVAVAVRTPPPITSREIAGVPVQLLGMAMKPFPARQVDRVGAVLRRIGTGDLTRYGLGAPAWGPFTARRPPVIDTGFLALLRKGRIEIRPDLTRLVPAGVVFVDGREEEFDAVVAATGFTTGLEGLIDVPGVLDERGYPRGPAPPGLFFAGYSETPRGQLFEANRAAGPLAAVVDRHLAGG